MSKYEVIMLQNHSTIASHKPVTQTITMGMI